VTTRIAVRQAGIALAALVRVAASAKNLDHARRNEGLRISADRFLIAAARMKGLVLATRDEAIIDYGRGGHVRVLKL
jgi:predicted nucleic acid-binding protein